MNSQTFQQWAAKRKMNLINQFCGFSVNDTVTYTNEFGVKFHNLKIIGIDSDCSFYGRNIYLNTDAYWFPHRPSELIKTN